MFAEETWDLAGALARQWFRDQCAVPFEPFQVFYRPSAGAQPGDVVVSQHCPGAGYLVAGKMLLSWTFEQARAHLYEIIRPLPILPTDGPAKPAHFRGSGGATRR
jgi:hypothetical protein